MRLRAKLYMAGLAVALLSIPVWAHTETVRIVLDHPATISGTELKPGNYQFKVKDATDEVNILKNGDFVAKVPCKWVQLDKKAAYTDVQFNKSTISELDFGGKTEAVTFSR